MTAIALQPQQSLWSGKAAPPLRVGVANPRPSHVPVPERHRHPRLHCRGSESRSGQSTQRTRELCQGPLRPGDLHPFGSGRRGHEVAQLHKTIARAGALLGGRRSSRIRDQGSHAARLQLQARQRRAPLRHPHTERSGSLCEDARSNAGIPHLAHARSRRQAGPGEDQGLLHRQSRNAASGELHRRASASPSFASTTYWAVHAFPATNSRARRSSSNSRSSRSVASLPRSGVRPRRRPPTSCTTISKEGSRRAISGSA